MFVTDTHNGLWTVEFMSTVNRSGKGVIVLNNGRLLGGDEGYYYSGSYEINESKIRGEISITRFDQNILSVFGNIDQFTLSFAGEINSYHFTLAAAVPNNKNYQIRIVGSKKEDM